MALVAVWLIVLAPTASRTLAAAGMPGHVHTAHASMAGMHHHGMDSMEMPATPQGHEDCGAACGYCTLFAQQPALGGSFFVGHVLPVAGHVLAVLPAPHAELAGRIVHAPARGPPFVVTA